MIGKGNNKYSSPIINNAKSEKFRQKLKNLLRLIFENKNNENYEFNHPLIEKHFLYKAVQEINKELTKNKQEILLDFSSRLHKVIEDELMLYWRLNGYITEDEILGINLVNEDFDHLNAIIIKYTTDKKFVRFFKKLETDSTVIYIDTY